MDHVKEFKGGPSSSEP